MQGKPIPTENLNKIKAVIFDVDGILTDCRIWLGDDGHWRRSFTVRDGIGIKALLKAGYKVGWITGSKSPDIRARAEMLGVPFLSEGQESKVEAFNKFLQQYSLREEEVACMGDDLPDIPLLKRAGISVTVPEAVSEVLEVAAIITKRSGGEGAARELCDMISKCGKLKIQEDDAK